MNVLLLNPPPSERGWYLEHLGIAYLAAVLRKEGHNACILDAGAKMWDIEQTYHATRKLGNVDLLGITAMDAQTFQAGIDVVDLLHRDGFSAHITAGGYFPTLWRNEILEKYPQVDSVVFGEGEQTVLELVNALEQNKGLEHVLGLVYRADKKVLHNQPRPLARDLDGLPFPARDYLAIAYQLYYTATVYSSRGCPSRCAFCAIPAFYRVCPGNPYRSRSGKNIATEIEILVNEHGVRFILFVDDEFLGGSKLRRRVLEELIYEIRRRQLDFSFAIQYRADYGDDEDLLRELKDVGLLWAFIGIESGLDTMLRRLNKRLTTADIHKSVHVAQDLDLDLVGGYMLFDAFTTIEELRQNVEYLLSSQCPTVLNLHGMGVLKGTPQEETLRMQGVLTEYDFNLGYRFKDKRIASFADLVATYHLITRPTVLEIYKLLALAGHFPKSERRDAMRRQTVLQNKTRHHHQQFLTIALEEVSQGRSLGGPWLDDLKAAYQSLYLETQQLVSEWKHDLDIK